MKILELESLFKTKIQPELKKVQSECFYNGENVRTLKNSFERYQDEKSDSYLNAWLTTHISGIIGKIESQLESKVDNDVLEELLKHLATREELKKLAKKKFSSNSSRNLAEYPRTSYTDQMDENIPQDHGLQKLKKELRNYFKDQIEALETRLKSQKANNLGDDISSGDMPKNEIRSIKKITESIVNEKMKLLLNTRTFDRAQKEGSPVSDDDWEGFEQKMRREFDEKLFLLCSDLSACKKMLSSQLYEPFHRCAQWIWKSGFLKMGSAIPWNIQTRNTGILKSSTKYRRGKLPMGARYI